MRRFLMLAGSLLAVNSPCAFSADTDEAAGPETMHVHEAKDRVSVLARRYRSRRSWMTAVR